MIFENPANVFVLIFIIVYVVLAGSDLTIDSNEKKQFKPFELLMSKNTNTFFRTFTSTFIHRDLSHLLGNSAHMMFIGNAYTNQKVLFIRVVFSCMILIHYYQKVYSSNINLSVRDVYMVGSSDVVCSLYGYYSVQSLKKMYKQHKNNTDLFYFIVSTSIGVYLLISYMKQSNGIKTDGIKTDGISEIIHLVGYLIGVCLSLIDIIIDCYF